MIKVVTKPRRLDFFGSILSVGCAIQCLAYPILISIGSLTFISDTAHELTETIFLTLTLVLGIWSLSTSYPHHRKLGPTFLIIASLILILFARVYMAHSYETAFNVSGALLIAVAHQTNKHFMKKRVENT